MSYHILNQAHKEKIVATLPPYDSTSAPAISSMGYKCVPQEEQILQPTNTDTIVTKQPHVLPQVAVAEPRPQAKPAILILSLVLTVVCGLHMNLPAFVCLTPGLIFAIVGYSLSDSPEAHQRSTARAFHGISLCCNIASIVWYALAIVGALITLGVLFGTGYFPRRNPSQIYPPLYGCWQDCSEDLYFYESSGSGDGTPCVTICS